MSASDVQNGARTSPEKIVVAVIAGLVLLGIVFVASQRQQELRRSPLGLDGLRTWLVSEGYSAQNFTGGWPLDRAEVGLNILPIYDTNLSSRRVPPRTKEDLIAQQDEYDVSLEAVGDKVSEVRVLAVLPKWRSGMRLTGVAHPVLISDPAAIENVLASLIDDSGAEVSYSQQPFAEFDYVTQNGERLSAVTYASQMFASEACKPVVGSQGAMLLGDCESRWGERLLVLSDPDMVNNHGLLLGDNAFIIGDIVQAWAADGRVIIDYSRVSWFTAPEERVVRERQWSDLLRFFQPPFTLMWVGAFLTLGLVLWRSAMRFGPLRDSVAEMSASKATAIEARANLMRLTGQDGALVNEYGRARLEATASAIFGPAHARQFSNPDAFLGFTQRRHPQHASALAAALSNIAAMPHDATAGQAMAGAAELERILEQIKNDTTGSG